MDFKLAELRKRRGITQKELAETLLVSPQTISKWENGMTCPDLEMLVRLTEYFGVTTDMLLGIAPLDISYEAADTDKREYWSEQVLYLQRREKNRWNEDYLQFLVQNVWKIHEPVKILDCGCGYGGLGERILPMLPDESTYTGIDFSEEMLLEAKKRYRGNEQRVKFILTDIMDYPVEQWYDLVICQCVLRHVNHANKMLKRMMDFLKPRGWMICMECNREFETVGLYMEGMDYGNICRHSGLSSLWEHQLQTQGRDFAIAMRLPQYMKQCGLKDIDCRMNDKVLYLDPDNPEYLKELDNLRELEQWTGNASEKRMISNLMKHGMSLLEAKDYYWKQKEIEQYIKVGNHPLIIKVEGMMITYGRKV